MSMARALLSHAIDYAGMFPPASLDLRTTVRNYETHRAGRDSWALGSLILPAKLFVEFAVVAPSFAEEWPISLLLDENFQAEIDAVESRGFVLNVVECKLAGIEQIAAIRRRLPETILYVEAPVGADLKEWLVAIANAGACAKIRTGGVTASAIPSVASVVDFLHDCATRRVSLKATGGLHHALRAERALTYQPGSECAVMHGFLNFFVAAAVVDGGGSTSEVIAVLEDESAANFQVGAETLQWQNRSFSMVQIESMRASFAKSFGSCSFTEPLEDMRAMGWLE